MVSEQECYNALILSRVGFFHLPAILKLLDKMGSATEVVEHSKEIREILPDASDRLLALFQDLDDLNVGRQRRWLSVRNIKSRCLPWVMKPIHNA